jgi:tetratricopeptide (TPR) repeat protein
MVAIPSLEPQMGKQTIYTLAQLYTMEKQYQKALDTLDDWFALEPNPAPEPLILKVQNLYQVDRVAEMVEPLEQAMVIATERGLEIKEDWYVLLNLAYFQGENYAKVRDIQTVLLENWPKERYVKSLVGAYVELGEWESALETVDGWFATNAVAEPDLYVTKAHILKQLKRYDEMVQPLEQAMAIADERGIEIEDEWRTLLASAQSPGRPNFCSSPPPDSAKPGTNPTGFRIGNIEGRWARWEWWVKDRSPRLKEEMARLSVDDIQSEIADFCTAKTLRWHLSNLVNKQGGVAQCFLDTGKTAELIDLSKSLKVPARRAGGYFVFDGCRDGVLDLEKCQRINSLVDELSQEPSETCERYYTDHRGSTGP